MVAYLAALSVWFLSLFDALATWYGVTVLRYAGKANPLMAAAIRGGPWVFFGVKMGLTTVIALFAALVESRRQPVASAALRGVLAFGVLTYAAVDVWHVHLFNVYLSTAVIR